ncbi:Glutathione-binding protein GsiB precursor [Stieleria maiorica]|uniref:Glutathione-binding protein GsiB n=2 Tax=Stieleria maiorica TaxID=2795974 RepID=A0A5B9MGH8_9BACT|nr:Glutathione-binding protein GsiB precursor [Stieleria maiorica]
MVGEPPCVPRAEGVPMRSSTLENRLGGLCILIVTIAAVWPIGQASGQVNRRAEQRSGDPDRIRPVQLREDDAKQRFVDRLVPGTHVKVFIPSLPYIYISHAINGAMIKPSDNARGWEYDMATSHTQIDDTTYEFKLRQGVQFQDGTPFDADAVVRNMEAFKKAPTLYSKIDKVFDRCEKVDPFTVRFFLTEKYGCFMNDLIWMQFYSEEYLKINGWNGKATCPNLSAPGPYGLGPYLLTEGYVEGDRQTPKAVLKANPNYWDQRYPKVETITVFTELDSRDAKDMVLETEGELDIAFIPPEYKVDTILSPYAKLVTSPTTNNIAIHMNLINGNPKLLDVQVRRALNEALHQRNLWHFVFDREATLSPTQASPFFPGMRKVAQLLKPYSELQDPYQPAKRAQLKNILEGLRLKVLTQNRYMDLWRGIETQLGYVGVRLDIEEVKSEKEIFDPLLTTNQDQNEVQWDLLIWGNDDWFFNHPFTAFLVYRTHNVWSTIFPDPVLDGYIEAMFQASVEDPQFDEITFRIVKHVYDQAYMLFVPTPNNVFAVNKEVGFKPYRMACYPLWKIQVTDQHWSVRRGSYPQTRKAPMKVTRIQFDAGESP